MSEPTDWNETNVADKFSMPERRLSYQTLCLYLTKARQGLGHEVWREVDPVDGTITDLQGLGKDVWRDVDAVDYVRELRSEWEQGSAKH